MPALALIAAGCVSGAMGSMLGLGGGVVLVPLLVLGLEVPISEAVPASLMCVVANSCAASARRANGELADVRLAITLELATVAGAIAGGFVAGLLAPATVAFLFGCFALLASLQLFVARARGREEEPQTYVVKNYPLGISACLAAGSLSAVLGVGGGPLKLPVMSSAMRVPLKVACATSNWMVGVTAAASVVAYAWRGNLKLPLVAPLVLGALLGAWVGSGWMVRARTRWLQRMLAGVLVAVASQMLWQGGKVLWSTGTSP